MHLVGDMALTLGWCQEIVEEDRVRGVLSPPFNASEGVLLDRHLLPTSWAMLIRPEADIQILAPETTRQHRRTSWVPLLAVDICNFVGYPPCRSASVPGKV